MRVRFIQTADAFRYREMLCASSRTVTSYCERNDFEYEAFIGLKRGFHAWQATFNRIPMLSDIESTGFRGWVIYLDADAFVADLSFDLRRYLASKSDNSAVMVSMGNGPKWAVNAGVVMLNMAHRDGRQIVRRWNDKFQSLSAKQLLEMEVWNDGCSDQSMLFDLLDEDISIRSAVYFESRDLMNSDSASFIRQVLRAYYPSLESRISAVKLAVADIMNDDVADVARTASVIISAFYRSVLGRDPDAVGLEHFAEVFKCQGVEAGIRSTLASMLSSKEYLTLHQG